MPADISIGVNNGTRAVLYLNRQLQALPPLRPLILAVKAFLQHHQHNEVPAHLDVTQLLCALSKGMLSSNQ